MEKHAGNDEGCRHCPHYFGLLERIVKLEEELAEVKRRLQYYENSNSPPSANSLLWRQQKRLEKEKRKAGNERGAGEETPKRKGHGGVSHSFKAEKEVRHRPEKCTGCGSRDLELLGEERRLIVDIPEPQPCEVTRHIIEICRCNGCGKEVRAGAGLPKRGMLGKNLLAMIFSLWTEARLPVRKIREMLNGIYLLGLSKGCINNALFNVSCCLEPFVGQVRGNINRSGSAHFDETSISVNGLTSWIWTAVSGNVKNAFITVEKSRGAKVLKKHFSPFRGVAIVDGWKAYAFFQKVQRCWAHILREAETLALRKGGVAFRLSEGLKGLYHGIKEELKRKPPPNRGLYTASMGKLRRLLPVSCRDRETRQFVGKVENAGKDLFTFLLHPVASTNNVVERVEKEPVVQRKVRGCLRNGKGMRMFGNLMTGSLTWKLRGLNPLVEVRKYL